MGEGRMSSWVTQSLPILVLGPPVPSKWKRLKGQESEVTQSCLTLCDPMDCSLPGSSIHGIFQARVLEWVAISFSRRSSWPKEWTWVSCVPGRIFTFWATRKAWSTSILLGKNKLKYDYHCIFTRGPKSKTLTTPNTGEDVEKQELLLIADGNAEWQSLSGRQNHTYT